MARPKRNRKVAYYRVSTKKQGDSGLGLEAQRAIVENYHNDIVAEFVEVESGNGTENRPELEKAIQLCQQYDHTLVVAKVDRLSRKTEHALEIYERLDGRLAACDIPNLDKFTLTIFMAIADRERELISIRTKAALAAAKDRGTELGTPSNLTPEAREKSAAVNKQKAKDAYRKLYGYISLLKDTGVSYRHIAQQLNEEGHRTRQGKEFQAMTVYRILERGNGE